MPASAPAPIGTSEPLVFQDVWTRTNEPIFKHVSVPGTYQKPAPYRLQTFTYSTGLAFTGRSAACPPATAARPAAAPRERLFTIFILSLQLAIGEGPIVVRSHPGKVPYSPEPLGAVPRLSAQTYDEPGLSMRLQTTERGDTGQPPSVAVVTLLNAPKQTMKNKPSHSRHGAIPKKCCIKNTKTGPSRGSLAVAGRSL